MSINTKELYRSANKLTAHAREIYADVEKAHEFMCEGFISEQQCAEIEADREKKMAPYEDGGQTAYQLCARRGCAVGKGRKPRRCVGVWAGRQGLAYR